MLLGLMLITSLSAHAKDCEEGASSMGMIRQCLFEQNYVPVEAIYKELIKSLGKNSKAVVAIKENQKDWSEFMDSTCIYVATTYKGGVAMTSGLIVWSVLWMHG